MDTEGLSVICAGLGSIEEDDEGNRVGYSRGEYCLDNLKDLLRFLRRDDPDTRDVFKQVCKWNIVAKDLIPIIEYCQDDRNLVLNAVKVLVFLTMPVEASSKDYNEQLDYLWGIKSAITSSDVIAIIVSLLEKPLENLESNEFTEDDWKLLQLVLTLFRNMLAVQDISVYQQTAGSANLLLSLRDDFLERLFHENVMDVIIIITQHISGSCRYLRHDTLLLLEMYHYIFMGQDPELIAKTCLEDSKESGDAKDCLESLKSIMQEEAEKRKITRLHAARHSQFSGAFARLTMDGSKTMCKGAPSPASCDKLLKPEKVHRGPSKRVMKDYTRLPTKNRRILELLHDFLNQFLTGGYNVLMQSIAEDIEKEHQAIQNSDVLMFFQLAQFITSFQYHKSIMTKMTFLKLLLYNPWWLILCGLVIAYCKYLEQLDIWIYVPDVLHFSKANICPKSNAEANFAPSASDDDNSTWFKGDICGPIAATMNESMFGLVVAKWHLAFEGLKETKNNAFLSVAGSLMKVMMRMLDLVLKLMPDNSEEPQTVRIILHKLFYDQTDQGLTQFLLNMVRSFDAHKQPKSDLADLAEIIYVVIRLMEKLQAHGGLRVARKSRRARRRKTGDMKDLENKTVEDDAIIQNDPPNVGSNEKESPTQTVSERNEDVNIPIQIAEVQNSKVKGQNTDGSLPPAVHEESNENHHNFITGEDDCDFSADEQLAVTEEVDFKITSLLLPLASSTIISKLCWLLKFYKSNSSSTNHYVLCLLRRICDDLDLAPMLYQLSFLVIFYDILNEQKACPHKEYESIVQFLTTLIRRMLRKMKSQPLLFVDVLFCKTRKDCHYINVESIQHEVGEMQKEVRNWGSAGGGDLSGCKGGARKCLADALGDDEYDVIIPNESQFEKYDDLDDVAGKKVLQSSGNQNNQIEGHSLKGDLVRGLKRKRRLVLNDKLEEKIRGLYEMYKDNLNCTQLIAEALDPDGNISPAQVSRKCKKLGLQLLSKDSINLAHPFVGDDEYNKGTTEADGSLSNSNCSDGRGFLRKPIHSRKRVRALDKSEEQKIRSLFEQFKDHTRCSHLIAKELDPTGRVTAAQVSRKLKKLGLHTSRMRTESNRNRVKEADASTDGEDSDNITLSSFRKRGKNDVSSKVSEKRGVIKSARDSSDDELLTSVLKKSRSRPTGEYKHMNTSIKQPSAGQDHTNKVDVALGERYERGQTGYTEPIAKTLMPDSPTSSSEDDTNGASIQVERGSSLLNQHKREEWADSGDEDSDQGRSGGSIENNDKYNELEDSGDEQLVRSINASPTSSAKRRRLRVVMDFDDDD